MVEDANIYLETKNEIQQVKEKSPLSPQQCHIVMPLMDGLEVHFMNNYTHQINHITAYKL